MQIDPAYLSDFSLITLDIVQNSVKAGAKRISIAIDEDRLVFRLSVRDDGVGMDKTPGTLAIDPAALCGNGLANLRRQSERCGGELQIDSSAGSTKVLASFMKGSADFPALGDMPRTVAVLIYSNPDIAFSFCHSFGDARIQISSDQVYAQLGFGRRYNIIEYIEQYLNKEYQIFGGSQI